MYCDDETPIGSLYEYVLKVHLLFRAVGGSPVHGSPTQADKKRVKRSHLAKKFSVGISYAAKIPLKSVALALRGSESEHAQDALRVLDIVLRQQQAKRYAYLFCHFNNVFSLFGYHVSVVCAVQRLSTC